MGRWRRAGRTWSWRDEATRAQIRAARADRTELGLGHCGLGQDARADRPGGAVLLAGTDPQRILCCLTYTKAVAAEMQNPAGCMLGDLAMLRTRCFAAALQAALQIRYAKPYRDLDWRG